MISPFITSGLRNSDSCLIHPQGIEVELHLLVLSISQVPREIDPWLTSYIILNYIVILRG